MNIAKLTYAFSGLLKRAVQRQKCPGCGSERFDVTDRKFFHILASCNECLLLYRYPSETSEEMSRFYQRTYHQAGLTTELPTDAELSKLLAEGFKGSAKDFTRIVNLFTALRVMPDAKVLDYGANWGYGIWQLRKAGYAAIGYELSEPRAEFSSRLGVEVYSQWEQVAARGPFDVVFSSHVLEHTPDPSFSIRQQLDVLVPGGMFIAVLPNGSSAFRSASYNAFHKLWGQVHPVMLSDDYFRRELSGPVALCSLARKDIEALRKWDLATEYCGTIDQDELLVVWQKPTER